jgi:hypothetical protein
MSLHWNNMTIAAFEDLKAKLCSAPILIRPDFSRPFFLYTDASQLGLGAILSQLDDDNKEHVICYASHGLHSAEENYDTTKLECLAMYWAIKHFQPYLYGKHFKLITDHNALIGLFNSPQPSGMMARWITFLSEFDFEPKYRPRCINNNADFLSQLGY